MTALVLRFSAAACAFAAVLVWEQIFPRRPRAPGLGRRWLANLTLQGVDAVVLMLVGAAVPGLLVGWAYFCEGRGLGLLHRVSWPFQLKAALGYALLDLVVYLQHRALHGVPVLWRLHRVHHADLDLDLTTGLRFHPGEILLSLALKAAAISLFGVHFLVVGVFEVALNAFSLITHANAKVPFEALVRWLVVTPDMHLIHHSQRPEETDSNYGFQLSLWDRLLGTYRRKPREALRLGLPSPEHTPALGPLELLWLPLEAP
jgi:sterol desaturase/sphingolipid hydroxylase (fatty acid hydroxylase superfamily)